MTTKRILIVIAVICFGLATIGIPTMNIALVPLGLAVWAASDLVK